MLITDAGLRPDTSTPLRDRYQSHRTARVNALWGVRDIGFVRVRGFDALNATQDLPVGFQLGTMFGRSLSVLGSRDDDVFVAADAYVGAGGPQAATRVQLQGEARYSNDDEAWDGILTSGHALQYVKITATNTASLSLEWSGGWHPRVPFNFTLANAEGGVRGYSGSRALGGQRAVARVEDRHFMGRALNLGDLGVAVFADAGRLWAGDIPYGITTPLRTSAGLSVLGAAPSGSARLWRVDLAVALAPEKGGRRLELHFESLDKQAARERTVPSSVFRWPR